MSLKVSKADDPANLTGKQNDKDENNTNNPGPNKPKEQHSWKRTKTGCQTCRKRRIKCDEAKPSCNNCLKANRTCEGYKQRLDFREGLNARHRRGDPHQATLPPPPVVVQLPQFAFEQPSIQIVQHVQPPPESKGKQPQKKLPPVPAKASSQKSSQSVSKHSISSSSSSSRSSSFSTAFPSSPAPPVPQQYTFAHEYFDSENNQQRHDSRNHGSKSPFITSNSSHRSASFSVDQHEYSPTSSNTALPPSSISTADTLMESSPTPVSSDFGLINNPSTSNIIQHSPIPTNPSTAFPQLLQHIAALSELQIQELEGTTNLAFYKPSATQSPLMVEKVFFLFNYFIRHFGSSMAIFQRKPLNSDLLDNNITNRCGLENFWSYDAPLMALNNPHVLNAILALASVQYTNTCDNTQANSFEFNCMTYYQNAVRGLREDLTLNRYHDPLATLTTCLLLAFFETMYGDLTQWYQHMSGARDMINSMNIGNAAAGAQHLYALGAPLTSLSLTDIPAVQACDILASYLHMEVMQSAIGRSQLLIPMDFWAIVPFRHAENNRLHMYDVLIRNAARLCSWVATDTIRKERLYGPSPDRRSSTASTISESQTSKVPQLTPEDEHDLEMARLSWNEIKANLEEYKQHFAPYITPLPMKGPPIITPFGPCYNYASSLDHFLVVFLHMCFLILIRNNPDIPAHGFETLRYSAQEGVPHLLVIFRSIPPSVPFNMGKIGDDNLDPGQIVRLFIDFCVPVFFAAVQVREPHQQDWISNWLEESYKFTGWNTTQKIIRGIKTGWTFQKSNISEMPANMNTTNSPDASMQPAIPSNSPSAHTPSSDRGGIFSPGQTVNSPNSSYSASPGSEGDGVTKEDGKSVELAKGVL